MALAKGDSAGARARLKSLLERDPVDVAALTALAQMAATDRDWAAAKDFLERARSAHADAVAPRIALSRLALATNDPELARVVSAEVLAIDAENPDALAAHAQALDHAWERGSAEPEVNKLDSLSSKADANARSLVTVAVLQRELGQLDRARANLLRAIDYKPPSTDAMIALIQVEALRGDLPRQHRRLDRTRQARRRPDQGRVAQGRC